MIVAVYPGPVIGLAVGSGDAVVAVARDVPAGGLFAGQAVRGFLEELVAEVGDVRQVVSVAPPVGRRRGPTVAGDVRAAVSAWTRHRAAEALTVGPDELREWGLGAGPRVRLAVAQLAAVRGHGDRHAEAEVLAGLAVQWAAARRAAMAP